MTLEEYARDFATHCARATLRPFLGWRVREVSNDIALRSTSFPRVERKGVQGFATLTCTPTLVPIPSHDAQHNAVTR